MKISVKKAEKLAADNAENRIQSVRKPRKERRGFYANYSKAYDNLCRMLQPF
ncbi:hypothetical protein SAMN05216352_105174 [Alteribacillus bidgolensis]|uniref:Uncharacterized protein n=1 Tax=Alteribacillus bidgolensis TaxID=930129 RepID=A0A1G8IFE2_9BACI|nr:hypothetical protein SAMN05216352_105174 [Alteribacillus bidgolensis]